jgi:hypothetical protein
MRPDVTLALSLALTLAACAIGALRVVDANEKEPLWALGLLLWLGACAAAVTAWRFDPARSALGTALLAEVPKSAAVIAGIGMIVLVGRRRGITELNSPLDALLYGAAAGFGFSICDGLIRATYASVAELQFPEARSGLNLAWMTVQSCLTEAAFGALIGAGVGGAVLARRHVWRIPLLVAGPALAVAAHAGYAALVLTDGVHAPGVSVAGVATVCGILAIVAGGLGHALTAELRVIRAELPDEESVTPADLDLLVNPLRRRRAYVRRLAAGDISAWLSERHRHNRQVALAFAKRRMRLGAGDAEEVSLLRAAVAAEATRPVQPWGRRPGLAMALAALVVVAPGIAAIVAASGGQAPSTFATRTSLAERELRRLAEQPPPRRSMRADLALIPGEWRLRSGRTETALVDAGAEEAYELEYESQGVGVVRYTVARFGTARDARAQAAHLARARDAKAWATRTVVTQVQGSGSARMAFCGDSSAAPGSPDLCGP